MNKNIVKFLKRIKAKGRYEHLALMNKFEFKSIEDCKAFQRRRLCKILQYSVQNVPYYREIFEKFQTSIDEENVFEVVKKFPILTKDLISKNFSKLKAENFSGHFYRNHSGGSSGQPADFLQDSSFNEENKATKIFFDKWAGREEGDFLLKIWGLQSDVLKGNQGLAGFIGENILNVKILDSFQMTHSKMLEYVDVINKKKPKVIEGYVHSIFEFAKFVKNKNIKIHFPDGIIAAAGTLHEDMKKTIEDVFGCKVFNQYGSRDAGLLAFSCDKQEGLHLNIFGSYCEVLDKDFKDCLPGQSGKVYITQLNNFVMPLVRYDIGDFVTLPVEGAEQCTCKRGLPLIKSIDGREVSVFKKKDGTIVPGEFFIHFVGVVFNKGYISKFQVIQEEYDRVVLRIVLEDVEGFNKHKQELEDSIKKVMGSDCAIFFEEVREIESLPSGKYLYTISKIK